MGFEPTAPRRVTGFQDQLLKPLGHLSVKSLADLYRLNGIYDTTFSMFCQVFFAHFFILQANYPQLKNSFHKI